MYPIPYLLLSVPAGTVREDALCGEARGTGEKGEDARCLECCTLHSRYPGFGVGWRDMEVRLSSRLSTWSKKL